MRRIHVERRTEGDADALVRSLGWKPPPAWTEIDREGAIEVLSTALMNDLVTDAPRMPFREAEARARDLIDECPADARFLTNGTLEAMRRGFGRQGIVPSAKADTGVIAVSSTGVSMMWIED